MTIAAEPQGVPVKRPATQRGRAGAVAVLVIGIVLVVLVAPGSLIAGLVWTAVSTGSVEDELVPVAPTGTVPLRAGSTASIYLAGGYGSSDVSCSVTGPDEADVPVVALRGSSSTEVNGMRYERVAELRAPLDGDYRFECLGPPATMVYAHPSSIGASLVVPVLVGVGASIVVGIFGLVLVVVGIVRLVRVNRERRMAAVAAGDVARWGGPPDASGGPPR
ncbi:hypothetical protein F8O01_11945 [Pseudoclavibacter chungangensis]|uniref:Serine/arginine repetitive matrix protein 2 n=1 Tax=Pseudoclavibacter chungangensis TaxID=587635 RepID=A0A7J5BRT8_9MICO|nr:hypothetical protein [Pseudoclavibacter chungangensis]KAB1655333.1 hypothetical protein F8O01_11945 [Pseudoclavibacter chungangensis]NYJ68279.1 hypothetical protein [Pseudoclavibacter chungangensis]